jgi:hypothetical protein
MDSKQKQTIVQIERHKKLFQEGKVDISLEKILGSEDCQRIINECREYRERIYTPIKTLVMFIKQVLNPDKSCKKAVAVSVTEQIREGNEISSNNTGPYCKARQRLPEPIVKELVKKVGEGAAKKAPDGWKIYGREIKLVDGTMAMMADTKENQNKYPQHGNQKEGAGFPLARLVVVMSLTVGTIIDYAVGANKGKGTGEQSLLRRIMSCINKKDILLADRYYPCFF